MKKLLVTSAIGMGDILYLKSSLDAIKHEYDQIDIHFAMGLIRWLKRNEDYADFVLELANLLFNEPPYTIVESGPEFRSMAEYFLHYNIKVIKPDLPILCQGQSLGIDPYLVITTKVRYFSGDLFKNNELWDTLKQLPYKIVVLGEREVEMNHEYINDNNIYGPSVYSIYPELVKNLGDKIIDMTIPALGITSPNIKQLRQDALIMSEAKSMITFGIGGNFTLGMSVAKNLVGFNQSTEFYAGAIFSHSEQVGNSFVTSNAQTFLKKIGEL
jgi:hypothetical protein